MDEVKVAEAVVNNVNGNLKVVIGTAAATLALVVGTKYAIKGVKKLAANHKEKKAKTVVSTAEVVEEK